MTTEYEARITRVTVLPKNDDLWSERATEISIEDKSAGEFVVIRQNGNHALKGEVRIDPEEWQWICQQISDMILKCRTRKP